MSKQFEQIMELVRMHGAAWYASGCHQSTPSEASRYEAIAVGRRAEIEAALLEPESSATLTDEQIDAVFNQMPDGASGFLKSWGYQQFARLLLSTAQARPAQVQSDPMTGHWICAEDVHRLVRGIDVALNGEHGAAKQAMLCDIAGLLDDECRKHGGLPLLELLDEDKSAEKLGKVAQAVRDFHYAMDTRQHGTVAASRALDAVQAALGMNWMQGAEAARRAKQEHDGS